MTTVLLAVLIINLYVLLMLGVGKLSGKIADKLVKDKLSDRHLMVDMFLFLNLAIIAGFVAIIFMHLILY